MVFLGQFPALTGATMNIRQGEVVLIRGLMGLENRRFYVFALDYFLCEVGIGTVLDFDLRTQRMELRAHIGLLGHRTGLYPDLTVSENLKFWASAYGANDIEVDKAMTFFGLNDRLGSVQVQNLSEGKEGERHSPFS